MFFARLKGMLEADHPAYVKIIETHERINHYTEQINNAVKNYSAVENRVFERLSDV